MSATPNPIQYSTLKKLCPTPLKCYYFVNADSTIVAFCAVSGGCVSFGCNITTPADISDFDATVKPTGVAGDSADEALILALAGK